MSLRIQLSRRKIINSISPIYKPRQIIIKPNQLQSSNIPIYFDKEMKPVKGSNNSRDIFWNEGKSIVSTNNPESNLQSGLSRDQSESKKNSLLIKKSGNLCSNYNADRLLSNEKYKEKVNIQLRINLLQKISTQKTLPVTDYSNKCSNTNKKTNACVLKKVNSNTNSSLNLNSNLKQFLYDNKLSYLLNQINSKPKNNQDIKTRMKFSSIKNKEELSIKHKKEHSYGCSNLDFQHNLKDRNNSISFDKHLVFNNTATSIMKRSKFELNRLDTGINFSKIGNCETKKYQKLADLESLDQISGWEDNLN